MFRVLVLAAVVATLAGCASKPPKDYAPEDFTADPKGTAKSYVDMSGGGVFDDSKTVLVPTFAVKYELRIGGTARAGGNKASLKASMAIAPEVLQQITDDIYAQYIADLKGLGYTVVEPDQIAEQFEEYKKYRETKMKPAPVADDENFIIFAPKGMKVEDRGALASAFTTNLGDVMNRATKKMSAISIMPTYIVGFANANVEKGYKRETVSLVQRVAVRPGSMWMVHSGGSMGIARLTKGVGTTVDYGTWAEGQTAGDAATNIMGALFSSLGGDKWSSDSKIFKPDTEKYKSMALERLKGAQTVLVHRAKMEL